MTIGTFQHFFQSIYIKIHWNIWIDPKKKRSVFLKNLIYKKVDLIIIFIKKLRVLTLSKY